jgi:hypothetical protein
MKELEHRTTKTKDGVPDCWCLPVVEVYERGTLVIHNDPKTKGGES